MRRHGRSLAVVLLAGLTAGWAYRPEPTLVPTDSAAPVLQALAEAPDFALVDTHGDKVRLSDYRGKIVALHFWAEWCASCKVDLRYFQKAYEKYGGDDVVVLGLAYASGDRDQVRRFVDELGVTFPVVVCDEDTRNLYSVASLPTNFIVDRQGRIRYVSRRLMNPGYWDKVFAEMIAEDVEEPVRR